MMTEDTDLPVGWAITALDEVTSPSKVKAEPSEVGETAYLGLENIESGTNLIIKKGAAQDVKSTSNVFQAGDVLYGKLRPYLNKVATPNFGGICSTDILVFPKQDHIDSKWLMWFLSRDEVVQYADHNSSGSQLPRISFEKIAKLKLPLPPLAEQKRIVQKIQALLSQVNAAKGRVANVHLSLKRFRQAVLAAACSGKLTEEWRASHTGVKPAEDALQSISPISAGRVRRHRQTTGLAETEPPEDIPRTWAIRRVRELAEIGAIVDFQDGNHGDRYPRSTDFGTSGIKFITAKQIFDSAVHFQDAPLLSKAKASQLRIGFAKPGDVLLTHNATVGRIAILPNEAGDCILGTSVTYYRLNTEVFDPTFCMYFMQSWLWQSQLELVMEQTTRNQVSVKKQAEFWIAIPPLIEQREIVSRAAKFFSLITTVEKRLSTAKLRADKMFQAVLSKAFRGELVPTEAELARAEGRDFESAEVLLELIRREREEPTNPSPRGQSTPRSRQGRQR
ncbi:hypothetical protein F0U59_17155 [Archangium gephyra]|nr:hypothetical protein F0U59_17155 [Archangium gephyra]